MQIPRPVSHTHPLFKVVASAPGWDYESIMDDSFALIQIDLPGTVDESTVEVLGYWCDDHECVDQSLSAEILKEKSNVQYAPDREPTPVATTADVQAEPQGVPEAAVEQAEVKQEVVTEAPVQVTEAPVEETAQPVVEETAQPVEETQPVTSKSRRTS